VSGPTPRTPNCYPNRMNGRRILTGGLPQRTGRGSGGGPPGAQANRPSGCRTGDFPGLVGRPAEQLVWRLKDVLRAPYDDVRSTISPMRPTSPGLMSYYWRQKGSLPGRACQMVKSDLQGSRARSIRRRHRQRNQGRAVPFRVLSRPPQVCWGLLSVGTSDPSKSHRGIRVRPAGARRRAGIAGTCLKNPAADVASRTAR